MTATLGASLGESEAIVLACVLRDRLANAVPPLPSPRVVVAHETPGRLRLRVLGGEPFDAPKLAAPMRAQDGVRSARATAESGSVLVEYDPAVTSTEVLLEAARRIDLASLREAAAVASPMSTSTCLFNSAVLAASLTGAVPTAAMVAAVATTALPTLGRATRALAARRLTVDVLDLGALVTSIATSRFATAAFMTWLLGVGDLVLARTANRAHTAFGSLLQLEVADAWRLRTSGRTERVRSSRLGVGDQIVVYAGERVAADGIIVRGLATLDEKALTGESLPRDRGPGEHVLAATVVTDGQIVVRVDKVGTDTAASRIVSILQNAEAKPMTLQRAVESAANRLVLPTIAVALGASLASGQLNRMISVLITDFGTGIRVAVPTTALAGMIRAARGGVLVKGSQYLERLARADTIIFDKTGTLTCGQPEVLDCVALGGRDPDEVIALAAIAECHQRHPVAAALRGFAESRGLTASPKDLKKEQYTIGKGLAARVSGHDILVGRGALLRAHGVDTAETASVRERHGAMGASSLYVAVDGRLELAIGYADAPRAESEAVVRALRADGRRRVILLSGDHQRTASAVGARIGVDAAYGDLLPGEKASRVRALQREGHVVAMVGDGINDAPALALADVGIALHGGTEAALETADVVLLEGGLSRLPLAFDLADVAMRDVHRSLATVVAPNAVAIVLGALGLMSPGVAAAINNGSTVVASLMALAPLRGRRGT